MARSLLSRNPLDAPDEGLAFTLQSVYVLGFLHGGVYERTRLGPTRGREDLLDYLLREKISQRLHAREAVSTSSQKRIASLDEVLNYTKHLAAARSEPSKVPAGFSSSLWPVAYVLARERNSIAILLFLQDEGQATLDTLAKKFGLDSAAAVRLLAAFMTERLVRFQGDIVALTLRGRELATRLRRKLQGSP